MAEYQSAGRRGRSRGGRRGRPAPKESFAATLIAWSLLVGGITFIAAPQLELIWASWTRPPEEIAAIERSRYFAGCNDARAAGAAPIYSGTPGYRPEMDGDGDGIACEPHY